MNYAEEKRRAVERLGLRPLLDDGRFSIYKDRENRLVVMPSDRLLEERYNSDVTALMEAFYTT